MTILQTGLFYFRGDSQKSLKPKPMVSSLRKTGSIMANRMYRQRPRERFGALSEVVLKIYSRYGPRHALSMVITRQKARRQFHRERIQVPRLSKMKPPPLAFGI
jgi:hypothetical protein